MDSSAPAEHHDALALDDLPLPAVAAVCRLLQLRDRFHFLISSASVWRQLGSSSELWDDLDLDLVSQNPSPCAAWLASKRSALCRLRLRSCGSHTIPPLQCSLARSSTLRELDWIVEGDQCNLHQRFVGGFSVGTLALPQMRTLRLTLPREVGEVQLDQVLRAATGLSALHISAPGSELVVAASCAMSAFLQHLSLPCIGGGQLASLLAGVPLLRTLSVSLTSVKGGQAGVRAIATLTALSALDLHLAALGADHPGAAVDLGPLEALTCCAVLRLVAPSRASAAHLLRGAAGMVGLTGLFLDGSPFTGGLPAELSALGAVKELSLAYCLPSTAGPQAADSLSLLAPLAPTPTRISLAHCSLPARLPPGAGPAALCALQRLELRGTPFSDYARSMGFLSALRHLTYLDLRDCQLSVLRSQLADLPSLAVLLLGGNPGLCSTGAAFSRLAELKALTRLDIAGCGLRALPLQLLTLTRLKSLEMDVVASIQEARAWGLKALSRVTALTLQPGQHPAPAPAGSARLLLGALTRLPALHQLSIAGQGQFCEHFAEGEGLWEALEEAMQHRGWAGRRREGATPHITFCVAGNRLAM